MHYPPGQPPERSLEQAPEGAPEGAKDWHAWSRTLQRWNLREPAATLLEAAGPLTVLAAQAIYLIQPLVRPLAGPGALNALAGLLEEPNQIQAFVHFLREEAAP